ncbi:hypothetical protein [Kitasatospora azatica]|uniref:hypothetical protein n=1 Tax=Kitasatospora azatica TaxID=58347 RepID=UPI000A7BE896|nr:hypothetical protein [Kitasatospora azatica]
MGRPEKPIPAGAGKELRAFIQHLRDLRAAAGLSLDDIARHPASDGRSMATFQRAVAGTAMPTEDVTIAFVGACGGDVGKALRLRRRAASAAAWAIESDPPQRISPSEILNLTDLRTAMRYILLQAGRPSSRALQKGAPRGHLPHTTLDRLLDTKQKPRLPSPRLLEAFLAGCHVPAPRMEAWMAAYHRLVAANPGLISTHERARIARKTFIGWGEPGWDSLHREEQERRFWSIRKENRHRTYPGDFGRDLDEVEEYTDQWAIEYANQKAIDG